MSNGVFISYSHQESTFVDSLAYDLRRHNVPYWVDFEDAIPGETWQEQIWEAIESHDLFLLILSSASTLSSNVQDECQRAVQHKHTVLLVIFEASPLPGALETYKRVDFIDFRPSYSRGLEKLLQKIRSEPYFPARLHLPSDHVIQPTLRWFCHIHWLMMLLIPALMILNTLVNGIILFVMQPGTSAELGVFALLTILFWLFVGIWYFGMKRIYQKVRQRRFRLWPTVIAYSLGESALVVNLVIPAIIVFSDEKVSPTAEALYTWVSLGILLIPLIGIWLFGSSGMYRWAGPGSGLTGSPNRLKKSVILFYLISNALCFSTAVLPPMLIGFVVAIVIAPFYFLSIRSSIKYRRHQRHNNFDTLTQPLLIAIDHAEEDSWLAWRIGHQMKQLNMLRVPLEKENRKQRAAPKPDRIISILSKNNKSVPTGTNIPTIAIVIERDDKYDPMLDMDREALDWSQGVTPYMIKSFLCSLANASQFAGLRDRLKEKRPRKSTWRLSHRPYPIWQSVSAYVWRQRSKSQFVDLSAECVSLGYLMECFGFNEDDLVLNQQGRLTSQQIREIQRNLYANLLGAFAAMVVLFGLFCLIKDSNARCIIAVLFCLGILFLIHLIPSLLLLISGRIKVVSITGRLFILRDDPENRQVEIGSTTLNTRKKLRSDLPKEFPGIYRAYCVKERELLMSIEPGTISES